MSQPIVPQFLISGASSQENGGGLILMAMLKLDVRAHDAARSGKAEGKGAEDSAARQRPGGSTTQRTDLHTFSNLNQYGTQINRIESR